MRVKSEIWVKAYIRRCFVEGVPAVVVRKGHEDAGAIFIKVNALDDKVWIYGPAPSVFSPEPVGRMWALSMEKPVSEAEAEDYLKRQFLLDPDIWVIELEDREARHFLAGYLLQS